MYNLFNFTTEETSPISMSIWNIPYEGGQSIEPCKLTKNRISDIKEKM